MIAARLNPTSAYLMRTHTEEILQRLIGFPTVSRDSNLAMIDYIQDYLGQYGIKASLTYNDDRSKANLHAQFGPPGVPGVMLSGHSDVVPVDGQQWSVEPFSLTAKEQRLYGRGSADMKGFIAAVLAMVPVAVERNLARSIHLAFSYDEEIGCVGVHKMIDQLEYADPPPAFCIIGEPTEMQVAIAHKGKTGALCVCRGVEAHSALVTSGVNAIYMAADMVAAIRQIQQQIILARQYDDDYSVPYTSLHVGTIDGGTALNIIPKECRFKFEIRHLQSDDPQPIMAQIRSEAERIAAGYHQRFPAVDIEIDIFNQYPALNTEREADVVGFVQSLLHDDRHIKLAFGTEGGLFQRRLQIPTVVCGPGSMDQGHKPDEFIARSELARCDDFLAALLAKISH